MLWYTWKQKNIHIKYEKYNLKIDKKQKDKDKKKKKKTNQRKK